MSAYIEVIDQYLEDLVAAAVYERDEEVVDLMLRIHGNYQASLNETATYHRYFTDLRDGKGGWAEETARLREDLQAEQRARIEGWTEVASLRAENERLRLKGSADELLLERKVEALTAEVERLREELERACEDPDAAVREENERLREENRSLLAAEEDAGFLREEKDEVQRSFDSLRKDFERVQAEVERLREDSLTADRIIREKNRELERLRQDLDWERASRVAAEQLLQRGDA
jgi:chromosome segregation ATPase